MKCLHCDKPAIYIHGLTTATHGYCHEHRCCGECGLQINGLCRCNPSVERETAGGFTLRSTHHCKDCGALIGIIGVFLQKFGLRSCCKQRAYPIFILWFLCTLVALIPVLFFTHSTPTPTKPPRALIIGQYNTQAIVNTLHQQGWKDDQITILTNPTTDQLTQALSNSTVVWYNGSKAEVEHTP